MVVVVDEEEAEGGLTTRVGGLAGELERGWASSSPKPLGFSTDSLAEEEEVEALRLPQVFYNQGLSSLRRSVSYVRAEH